MKGIRLTYILSNLTNADSIFNTLIDLRNGGYIIRIIFMNPGDSKLEQDLKEHSFPVQRIIYNGKKDLFKAFINITYLLIKHRPHIVHTHLFDASLSGLLSSYILRINKRIHTRHHSSIHHDEFPSVVKFDKLINFLSTDIIAISLVVKKYLILEDVPDKKITLILHGFKTKDFLNPDAEKVKILLEKYNPGGKRPVIGVVSRYMKYKSVDVIIEAFKLILKEYSNAFLILANAKGPEKSIIKQHLKSLSPNSYREISFEPAIIELYQLFDVFVHVPDSLGSEAFGQVYIEALLAKIPSVFTRSGIAAELFQDDEGALMVDYKNPHEIYSAIKKIIEDQNLQSSLKNKGLKKVESKFNVEIMLENLKKLYEN